MGKISQQSLSKARAAVRTLGSSTGVQVEQRDAGKDGEEAGLE